MKLLYARIGIKNIAMNVVDQEEEEDHLFNATCFSSTKSSENWLIDNGCTHMTHNKDLFKKVSNASSSKVWVANDNYIAVIISRLCL